MQIDGKIWPPLKGIQDGEYKLTRTLNAFSVLGDCHLNLKNVIHVGGTNGKGSSVSFIKNILNAHGYTTNVYTSPHLVKVNERIQIHSRDITDDVLRRYTEEVYFLLKKHNLENTLTYFEGLTVIAFYIFAKERADFNIIEVGLGGRFDATNVIRNPLISVITSISMDHTDYLGDTLEAIAGEKAEIIKMDSMVAVGFQMKDSLYRIFENKAKSFHALCRICTKMESVSPQIDISYQKQNANLAMLAVGMISDRLGIGFDYVKSVDAISQTKWPGRLQKVFVRSIGREVTVDSAHNVDGIAKFLDYIMERGSHAVLICSMLRRKVTPEIFRLLQGFLESNPSASIITTNFEDFEECFPSKDFCRAINHERCSDSGDLAHALKSVPDGKAVYLCGSIHFIGNFFQKVM